MPIDQSSHHRLQSKCFLLSSVRGSSINITDAALLKEAPKWSALLVNFLQSIPAANSHIAEDSNERETSVLAAFAFCPL